MDILQLFRNWEVVRPSCILAPYLLIKETLADILKEEYLYCNIFNQLQWGCLCQYASLCHFSFLVHPSAFKYSDIERVAAVSRWLRNIVRNIVR